MRTEFVGYNLGGFPGGKARGSGGNFIGPAVALQLWTIAFVNYISPKAMNAAFGQPMQIPLDNRITPQN